ncbi:MAG: DUF3244 domain-containing protein [Candidatus Cryptobacteroides sp.]
MKKKYLIMIAALLVCNLAVFAKPLSENERENVQINIKLKDRKTNQTHTHRSPAKTPIEVFYSSEISSVAINFMENLQNVEINIMNHSTGEYIEGMINATMGMTLIPISGTDGYYTVTFILSDGKEYFGEFEL